MARSKHGKSDQSPRILNRRAQYAYHITDCLEVGIELQGSEVKSVRSGQVSLAEGFARVDPNTLELYLYQVDIARYPHAGTEQHEPKKIRKLLVHRRQIKQLLNKTLGKGVTLVPVSMYFVRGRIKLELGVGVGKSAFDKRAVLKKREADRAMERGMTRKIIR